MLKFDIFYDRRRGLPVWKQTQLRRWNFVLEKKVDAGGEFSFCIGDHFEN